MVGQGERRVERVIRGKGERGVGGWGGGGC